MRQKRPTARIEAAKGKRGSPWPVCGIPGCAPGETGPGPEKYARVSGVKRLTSRVILPFVTVQVVSITIGTGRTGRSAPLIVSLAVTVSGAVCVIELTTTVSL